ncbi:uncharacterized protein BJ212DRAFT_1485379 [Suillus subaureus]|uniref:Uncharacterized protein n=1 Tax=Suillus subaureus TaxID=48587 RepID=A0A9P7E0C4_9AGAM|nr:uncharacterized protein BJ212DRAFT_1485379 [Suillus subaureus]KAG1807798.1 hypothetical protein BJ212DRAFT_1485379 [Suillus subaureus]
MSTPVDTSLTSLKASTAQIMAIISGAWQTPPGPSHFALTSQAHVVKDYGAGPPAQHHAFLLQGANHIWYTKLLTWEVLGDHIFDLSVATPPSTVLPPTPPLSTETRGKPFSGGVLEVVLPQLSNSPQSPWVLMKKPFGAATAYKSHLCVWDLGPSQPTPKTNPDAWSHQDHTVIKAPAPAPASLPSLSWAVPAAALNIPMPDLHAMAIVIQDGAAQITILEAHVAEQDGKIDTLQCIHEGLRREIINQYPSFPIPDPPANATSLLLDQSIPTSMSPPKSALPPLIDLSVAGIVPTPLKFENTSAIEGLLFEYNQVVHPEDPDMSGEIMDPGDPSNLVPGYNSSDNMDVEVDVEVKVEASSEEVDMAT